MGYLTTGIEPKDRAGGAKFGVSINESEKWGRYAQRNSLATLCDCREKKVERVVFWVHDSVFVFVSNPSDVRLHSLILSPKDIH